MSRYTPKQLERDIDDWNAILADSGVPFRIQFSPRNGYQAADATSIDPATGELHGSGCIRNIGCGTSREVARYCSDYVAACLAEKRLVDSGDAEYVYSNGFAYVRYN